MSKGRKREREREEKEERNGFLNALPYSPPPFPLRAPSIYEYVSVEAWKGRCEVSREEPSSRYAIRPLMATLSLLSTPQKAPLHYNSPPANWCAPFILPRPPLGHGDGPCTPLLRLIGRPYRSPIGTHASRETEKGNVPRPTYTIYIYIYARHIYIAATSYRHSPSLCRPVDHGPGERNKSVDQTNS